METMTTNDLPASVKVGHKVYRIENWDPNEAHAEKRYGDTTHNLGRIRVNMTYGPPTAAETLLHEILHAVWWIWGIQDDDKEERTVRATSDGLATVIRDNPDVFAWIARNVAAS